MEWHRNLLWMASKEDTPEQQERATRKSNKPEQQARRIRQSVKPEQATASPNKPTKNPNH